MATRDDAVHAEPGRVGELAAKVGGLESQFREIKGDFAALRTDVDENFRESRRQNEAALTGFREDFRAQLETLGRDLREGRDKGTPWGTIVSAVGVIIVLAGAILYPINSNQTKMESVLEGLGKRIQSDEEFFARRDDWREGLRETRSREASQDTSINERLTRNEHEEFAKRIDLRDEQERLALFRELDSIHVQVNRIDSDLIKRPEVTALLEKLSQQIESDRATGTERSLALNTRVTDIEKTVQSISPPSDVFKSLESRVNELYRERLNSSVLPPASQN